LQASVAGVKARLPDMNTMLTMKQTILALEDSVATALGDDKVAKVSANIDDMMKEINAITNNMLTLKLELNNRCDTLQGTFLAAQARMDNDIGEASCDIEDFKAKLDRLSKTVDSTNVALLGMSGANQAGRGNPGSSAKLDNTFGSTICTNNVSGQPKFVDKFFDISESETTANNSNRNFDVDVDADKCTSIFSYTKKRCAQCDLELSDLAFSKAEWNRKAGATCLSCVDEFSAQK